LKCLCGKKLDRIDLLQGSCQSCADPILPDDAAKLRAELGMAEAAPPEVEAPVIENTPKVVPDSVDCPGCGAPLMGEELNQWWTGSCAYCGEENPDQGKPPAQDSTSAETPSSDEDEKQPETILPPEPPVELIVNIGPMCGTSISIPAGIVGRDILSAALTDPWYHDHLARVSAEHFEIDSLYQVTDLGSSNGTFIDGNRITGTQATRLPSGTDLNIGRNLQFCSRSEPFSYGAVEGLTALDIDYKPDHISVRHQESGVRFELQSGKIHLGRNRPSADSEDESPQEEPWARMAKIQMTAMDAMDPKALNYISRNHLTLNFSYNRPGWSIDVDVPEGKAKPEGEIPEEASTGDSFSFTLSGNTFEVELLEF